MLPVRFMRCIVCLYLGESECGLCPVDQTKPQLHANFSLIALKIIDVEKSVKPQDHNKETQMPFAVHLAIYIGALCVMGALMYYSYTYPYSSGKPPGLVSFVLMWFREIVILLFGVIALVLIIVISARKRIHRVEQAGKNAAD